MQGDRYGPHGPNDPTSSIKHRDSCMRAHMSPQQASLDRAARFQLAIAGLLVISLAGCATPRVRHARPITADTMQQPEAAADTNEQNLPRPLEEEKSPAAPINPTALESL